MLVSQWITRVLLLDAFSLSWEVQIALKVAEAECRITLGFTILLVFVHIL